MCDPELIAAILKELGYLDEKKQRDNEDEVYDEERNKDNFKNFPKEEQK
jgi:hypothetical protein